MLVVKEWTCFGTDSLGTDINVITFQSINIDYLEGDLPREKMWMRENMRKKSLETVSKTYVGVPYSLRVAHLIESCGYGFVVSCETGNISSVFDPCQE